jgi:hypothetical protein
MIDSSGGYDSAATSGGRNRAVSPNGYARKILVRVPLTRENKTASTTDTVATMLAPPTVLNAV